MGEGLSSTGNDPEQIEYLCAECGLPVHYVDCKITRPYCEHDWAGVQANLKAKVYGESHCADS